MTTLRPLMTLFSLMLAGTTLAAEWHGLLDIRAVASDTAASWTEAGLGKQRYGNSHDGLRLGQALLRVDAELMDELSTTVIVKAADEGRGIVDVSEAWLSWKPIPASAWQTRIKAGAFFPAISLENDALGWTTSRTLSSSAINSWLGEELRTLGVEAHWARRGRQTGSPHDFGITAAVFGGNDPAGTLLAWRGWSISDRITGLSEPLKLADLPIYRPGAPISKQSRDVRELREIDNRAGYYLGADYGYDGWLNLALLHYDNRGDPLVVKHGQYAWPTRFDHLGLRLKPGGDWELLAQWMRVSTSMGADAVNVHGHAWYALLSHPLGAGHLSLRHDRFGLNEHDRLPRDPNNEQGRSWTLAYRCPLATNINLIGEWLQIDSTRPARSLLGQAPRQRETSLTAALRWQF